jgi:hypothetical protein
LPAAKKIQADSPVSGALRRKCAQIPCKKQQKTTDLMIFAF